MDEGKVPFSRMPANKCRKAKRNGKSLFFTTIVIIKAAVTS